MPTWVNNNNILREFIRGVLADVVTSPEDLDTITSNECMKTYWVKAFTHRTIDAMNNYESLEFYGDAVIAYTFSCYIRKRFGASVTQYTGTLLSSQYISKSFQAKLSNKMGLRNQIYYDPRSLANNEDLSEDILESFFGALNNSSDDILGQGMGNIYCYNLIVKLYENENIVIEELKLDPKTYLKQMIDKLVTEQPVYEKINEQSTPGYTVVRARMPLTGQSFKGYGRNKTAAEFDAARRFIEFYETQRVTMETADEIKLLKEQRTSGEILDIDLLERAKEVYKIRLAPSYPIVLTHTFTSNSSRPGPSGKKFFVLNMKYNDSKNIPQTIFIAQGIGNTRISAMNNAIAIFAKSMGVTM